MLLAQRSLTIKELFSNSLHWYKVIFPQIWGLVLILAILQSIPTLLDLDKSSSEFLLITNVLLLPGLYLDAMLLIAINNLLHGKEKKLKETFFIMGHRFVPYIALMLFFGTAVGIGFVLFILPALFVILFFAFAVPYFLFDQLSLFASLKGSFNLVKASWLQAILGLFASGVILVVLMFFSYLPSLIQIKNVFIIALGEILSYVFIAPLLALFWIGLFYDLKIRKESLQQTKVVS